MNKTNHRKSLQEFDSVVRDQFILMVENLWEIQAVSVCFALKIISGGIAMPAALIHLIAVIQLNHGNA